MTIDNWIDEAEEAGEVAVDTETSSLDPHTKQIYWYFFKF